MGFANAYRSGYQVDWHNEAKGYSDAKPHVGGRPGRAGVSCKLRSALRHRD
jgi:hypothetical protein